MPDTTYGAMSPKQARAGTIAEEPPAAEDAELGQPAAEPTPSAAAQDQHSQTACDSEQLDADDRLRRQLLLNQRLAKEKAEAEESKAGKLRRQLLLNRHLAAQLAETQASREVASEQAAAVAVELVQKENELAKLIEDKQELETAAAAAAAGQIDKVAAVGATKAEQVADQVAELQLLIEELRGAEGAAAGRADLAEAALLQARVESLPVAQAKAGQVGQVQAALGAAAAAGIGSSAEARATVAALTGHIEDLLEQLAEADRDVDNQWAGRLIETAAANRGDEAEAQAAELAAAEARAVAAERRAEDLRSELAVAQQRVAALEEAVAGAAAQVGPAAVRQGGDAVRVELQQRLRRQLLLSRELQRQLAATQAQAEAERLARLAVEQRLDELETRLVVAESAAGEAAAVLAAADATAATAALEASAQLSGAHDRLVVAVIAKKTAEKKAAEAEGEVLKLQQAAKVAQKARVMGGGSKRVGAAADDDSEERTSFLKRLSARIMELYSERDRCGHVLHSTSWRPELPRMLRFGGPSHPRNIACGF